VQRLRDLLGFQQLCNGKKEVEWAGKVEEIVYNCQSLLDKREKWQI
jgi:hypothetical protein